MTSFTYHARDPGGAPVTGAIEASDRRQALEILAGRGLFPSRLEEGRNGRSGPAVPESPSAHGPAVIAPPAAPPAAAPGATGRISRKHLTAFTRELATLLAATIPIPQALRGMGQEEDNPALRQVIQELDASVRKGNSLSTAMKGHPKLFPILYTSMIQVGEEAGALDKVLGDLADLLEHEDEVRGEVVGAVAYPCFVLVMGVLTTLVLLAFVLPRLFDMLKSMIAVLPLPTRILLSISGFFQAYWPAVLVAAAAAVLGLRWFLRSPAGRLQWDTWKLRIPFLGGVFRASALGRFTRTLGTLARSGVSILPALEIVRSTIGNRLIEQSILRVAEETRAGDSLAAPLRKVGLFPSTMIQMISVGEETGRLDEMLMRIAVAQERQMRASSRTLISLLAPALILLVGLLVGFIVIALLLPIFRMSQGIH